jgi:predicted DNA-binding transcriptional regulator YafY
LLSIRQSRRDWTGPELAARLQVTTRTVRNDVERLRQLGYPVDATPDRPGTWPPSYLADPVTGRTRPGRVTRPAS